MKRFALNRLVDETGISGTGLVAEGVVIARGKVVLSWLTQYNSLGIYDSLAEMMAIHGHGGKTRIDWLD